MYSILFVGLIAILWGYFFCRARIIVSVARIREQLVDSHTFHLDIIENSTVGVVGVRASDSKVIIQNRCAQVSGGVLEYIVEAVRDPGVDLCGDTCLMYQGRWYSISLSTARYQEDEVLIYQFSDITQYQQSIVALDVGASHLEKVSEGNSIFLETMIHELRAPLYEVFSALELSGFEEVDKRQNEYVQVIKKSSAMLLKTMKGMMDIAEIEAGRFALETTEFSPLDMLEDLLSAHVSTARAKGLDIYACIDSGIPGVLYGDAIRIQQILNNLLNNAVRFTSIGRVVLHCRVIRSSLKTVHLECQVTDTGVGVSQEQQCHLFSSIDLSRSGKRINGTGLGLSVCSRLAELMGGEVSVVSELGLGSSFTLSLPFDLPRLDQPDQSSIDLSGTHVYVRAPIHELAESISSWLARCGANATVISAVSFDAPTDALLIEILGEGKQSPWNGRRIVCEYDGPLFPAQTDTGWIVSVTHVQAIANAVAMEKNRSADQWSSVPDDLQPAFGLHVLVALDKIVNQATLKEQLEALGCSVVLARDGLHALHLWSLDNFDLVLSDIGMQVLNGYELARSIREKHATVPIIGITSNFMGDEGLRGRSAGMSSWLVKPVSLMKLRGTIIDVAASAVVSALESAPITPDQCSQEVTNVVLSDAMRSLFYQTMEQDLLSIKSAMASGSRTDLIQKLHRVSGALSVVRADKLSGIFARLEYQLREQSVPLPVTEIDLALDLLSQLLASI